MNENYIDIVRRSLYNAPKKEPQSLKKIVFYQGNYKSENVFEDIPDGPTNLSKNKNTQQKSVIHRENKKEFNNFQGKKKLRGKQVKKKEQKDSNYISKTNNTPSKSEIENITRLFGKNGNNKNTSREYEVESDEEEFDVDIFFNTRDHSFNESITEAHSGIDYEFVSDCNECVSDCNECVKITGYKYNEANKNITLTDTTDTSDITEPLKEKKDLTAITGTEKKRFLKGKLIRDGKRHDNNETREIPKVVASSDGETKNIFKNKKVIENGIKRTREIIKPKENVMVVDKLEEQVPSCSFTVETGKHTVENKINKQPKHFLKSRENVTQTDKFNLSEKMRNLIHDNENGFNNDLDTTSDEVLYQNNVSQVTSSNNKTVNMYPQETMLQPIILDINDDNSDNISKIIFLKENVSIPFYGMFALQVLHGQVEVLGTILDKSSTVSKLFSPRGSALLSIKNITNGSCTTLNQLLPDVNTEDILIDNKTAVIKCSKIEDKYVLFVEKYISQQIFPKFVSNSPQVTFQPKEDWNILTINESWNDIINVINPSTKLLIAGGKGVGKSTFLRYAINQLLMKYEEIRVVDLDPGQSEFFVPGCISVLNIRTPVFGPNYTHLMSPDRSLLSDINIGHNPSAYIDSIASLMEYISLLDSVPTLINYMGFSKGIGLKIISSAISYIQPTDIVQITSKNRQKNFSKDLNPNVIKENCNFFGGNPDNLNFNLHIIPSMSDHKVGGWSLEPRQAREMCVLAYLGTMMKENITTLTDHNLPMYRVNLSAIKLINTEKTEISPASVNANLVALCNLQDSKNFLCYGYGIIRGIDLENDILILITPVSVTTLENVHYLVLGNVSLPPSVYMMPENVSGLVPYVMEGELEFLGQITKRTYLPATKR